MVVLPSDKEPVVPATPFEQTPGTFEPLGSGISLVGKPLQSPNFRTGSQGWRIDSNGNAEFNDGTFRGTFNIGGQVITIDNTEDIQENLDLIESEGGGTLYLQAGTYTLTADLTIPGNVVLKGVARDSVIIDCDGAYAVKITGTNVYSAGTVTINDGDTEVVGSGTTWTSAMVGRYILLDGYWYEITAFTDTTHIDITAYSGVNLSGASYVLSDVNFNGAISTLSVMGATGSGLVISYAMEPIIDDLVIYDCGTGIDIDYVVFPRILVTSTENGVNMNMNECYGFLVDFSEFSFSITGAGIIMTNSANANFYSTSVVGNTGNGISMTSVSKLPIVGCDISSNGGHGIEMISGCNDNQISTCLVKANTSVGIKLTASSDRNVIDATPITDNGTYGVHIANANCDNNVLIGVVMEGNGTASISDSGTGTLKSTTVNVLP